MIRGLQRQLASADITCYSSFDPAVRPRERERARNSIENLRRHSVVLSSTSHQSTLSRSCFAKYLKHNQSLSHNKHGLLFARPTNPPRNSRPGVPVMSDGLTAEETFCVRDRCKRMIAATATAAAAGAWVDARKALLDTAFETHPDLDQADLEKYLAIRGLVSVTTQLYKSIHSSSSGRGQRTRGRGGMRKTVFLAATATASRCREHEQKLSHALCNGVIRKW